MTDEEKLQKLRTALGRIRKRLGDYIIDRASKRPERNCPTCLGSGNALHGARCQCSYREVTVAEFVKHTLEEVR